MFVWIDHTAGAPWPALRSLIRPLPAIELPELVTTVWVAALTHRSNGRIMPDAPHSITPPRPWRWHGEPGLVYPRIATLLGA